MRRALLIGLVAISAAAALGACKSKGHAEIDGILIPQADGTIDAPDGATMAVNATTIDTAKVPDGSPVVRLAIAREVPWDRVAALVERVKAAGRTPLLLAGDDHKVKGFRLEDEAARGVERAITVIAYVDGQACVQPPGAIEAKCVKSPDGKYIDRAFLRELVREQVKVFDVKTVEVEVASGLPWADVVRTIDGARTCCYETEVAVRLKRAPGG
jgi:hypothetical protein